MALEIERKFLVKGDFTPFITHAVHIVQAYLCISEDRTIRVRIKGEKAFLTVKGAADNNGFSRLEFEYPIPVSDAREMIRMSPFPVIDKVRNYVPCAGHVFEVDVFSGLNEGLILAELELQDEKEEYVKPDWLGEEVTGNPEYYNAFMVQSANR